MKSILRTLSFAYGFCGIAAGIVFGATNAAPTAFTDPEPGTPEYFTQYIEGHYIITNGTMVRYERYLKHLDGTVVQKLDDRTYLVRPSSPWTLLARYGLLTDGEQAFTEGQVIRVTALPDGTLSCVTEGGLTNMIEAYRTCAPHLISLDEYLAVFKSGVPTPDRPSKVVSFQHGSQQSTSYAERRRQRLAELEERRRKMEEAPTLPPEDLQKRLQEYQMELIRAGGAKGPPLPFPPDGGRDVPGRQRLDEYRNLSLADLRTRMTTLEAQSKSAQKTYDDSVRLCDAAEKVLLKARGAEKDEALLEYQRTKTARMEALGARGKARRDLEEMRDFIAASLTNKPPETVTSEKE